MMDPFEAQDLPLDVKETWQALDDVSETRVSDHFEARLMARIENIESLEAQGRLTGGILSPSIWQWLDGLFDFLHVPALAIVIALLFWLPTSSPQTAYRLDFPSLENPRSMQNHGTYIFEPQKILKLLIYISRS
jgi:hypothetical protein